MSLKSVKPKRSGSAKAKDEQIKGLQAIIEEKDKQILKLKEQTEIVWFYRGQR